MDKVRQQLVDETALMRKPLEVKRGRARSLDGANREQFFKEPLSVEMGEDRFSLRRGK
jgi:hypothetical protein